MPTTLNKTQLDWAEGLVKTAPDIEKNARNLDKRNQVIGSVSQKLTGSLDEIKAGQTYELEMTNTGITGKLFDMIGHKTRLQSHDPGQDPNKEIDTGHYKMSGMEELDPETVKRIMIAQSKLVALTDEMRNAKAEDGEDLFTEADIAKEIWGNLVRQGVIPENAVPDAFSEVVQTFTAASAAYQDRLAEYTDELEDNHSLLKKLGVADSVINKMGDLSKSVVKALGALDAHIPADEVTSIIELIQISGSGSIAIAKQMATTKDPAAILSAFGDIAAKAVTAGFIGQDSDQSKVLKSVISNAVTIGFSSTKAAAKLAQGDAAGAFQDLAEAVGAAIAEKGAQTENAKEMKDIGAYVAGGLKFVGSLGKAGKALQEKNYDEVIQQMAESVVTGLTTGLTKELSDYYTDANPDDLSEDDLDTQIETQSDELKEALEAANEAPDMVALIRTNTPEALEKLIKTMEGEDADEVRKLRDALNKISGKEVKQFDALQKKRNAAKAKVAMARSEEDEVAFRNALSSGDDAAPDDIQSIERMILEIKRQQKVLELAIKLAKMPFNVVGSFFPPAKMGASLIAMAAEMRAAIKCTQEYIKWRDSMGDAKAAASVQAEAMANRSGLSSLQALRHGIEAAIQTTKAIGEGLQLGAHFTAHIGIALAAGASAASSAKAIIIEIEDEAKMQKAWILYRNALANPKDRLTIRKVFRKHATMAKYAIAYGALYDNNPVAKNAMQKCGLSEKVLTNRESNIDKVVKYMETLYAEDPVILRAVARPQDWHPKGEPALTAESWLRYVQGAQKSAKLAPDTPVAAVNSALALLASAKVEYDKAAKPEEQSPEAIALMLKQSGIVLKALRGLKPLDTDGNAHDAFLEYVDTLKALTELEIVKLEREQKLIPEPDDLFGDMFAES